MSQRSFMRKPDPDAVSNHEDKPLASALLKSCQAAPCNLPPPSVQKAAAANQAACVPAGVSTKSHGRPNPGVNQCPPTSTPHKAPRHQATEKPSTERTRGTRDSAPPPPPHHHRQPSHGGGAGQSSDDVVQDEVGALVHVGHRLVAHVALDHGGGHAHRHAVRRQVADDQGAGAHLGAGADVDRAQHGDARAQQHAVPHLRVARVAAHGARPAQRHAVQHGHVVAHHRGLADHHARGVVKQQPPAQARARVDVHAKHLVHARRQRQRQAAPPAPPQPVAHAVRLHRLVALEVQHALRVPGARRVAVQHALQVRARRAQQLRLGPVRVAQQAHELHGPRQLPVTQLVGQQRRQRGAHGAVRQHHRVQERGQARLQSRVFRRLVTDALPQRVARQVVRSRAPPVTGVVLLVVVVQAALGRRHMRRRVADGKWAGRPQLSQLRSWSDSDTVCLHGSCKIALKPLGQVALVRRHCLHW
mmetsp:Transcript_21149/g.53746  ORF Transcript_21149/g.53746 Transcript_21149/m.53746 type:complete len:474 (-) Transcript_21149:286-1707(-)